MTAKEFLQTYGINDDTIYDNAERMHSLECLLEDYAQERVKLFAIPVVSNSKVVFCVCTDKCSSKRTRYICRAKRKCIHKKQIEPL